VADAVGIEDAAPAITVVVVNYNAGRHLAETIAGLKAQTFRDFETILIDNASTDGSIEAALAVGAPCEDFRTIRLVRNTGFASANNVAARRAKGRYLALLNPDAFPELDWLAQLLAAAEAHPEAAAFGSRMIDAGDPGLLDGTGDVYTASGAAYRRDHGLPLRPRPDAEVFGACAAAALYRRDLFLALGGFDERLFCYLEDVDLAFRLRLAGHVARHVDAAIVRHVGGASSGGGESDFAVYHGQRNLVRVFLADMPGWLLWRYLPAHILLNLALIVRFGLRGQLREVLRAKRDALRALPETLARRRTVQAGRKVPASAMGKAIDRRPFALFRHAFSRQRRSGAGTTS